MKRTFHVVIAAPDILFSAYRDDGDLGPQARNWLPHNGGITAGSVDGDGKGKSLVTATMRSLSEHVDTNRILDDDVQHALSLEAIDQLIK